MSFDWAEYLKLARDLAGQTSGQASLEARLRSSVGRAYYAAFCKARNHLRDVEGHQLPSGADIHAYVRDEFRNSHERSRSKMGGQLDRLRMFRNMTDYNDVVLGLEELASVSIRLSRKIISTLNII